jgi:hypothetical protein
VKADLASVLDVCEMTGGAVAPPTVLALVAVIRRYSGIIGTQAQIIQSGVVTGAQLSALADEMADARIVTLPDMPLGPIGLFGKAS